MESKLNNSDLLNILLLEYDKLKEEQNSRISMRDSLIYISLGIFGAIFSFTMTNQSFMYTLLLIPPLSFILSWLYISNDSKILEIKKYIKNNLEPKIAKLFPDKIEIFEWEKTYRDNSFKKLKKVTQFLVEEITFSVSAISALITFFIFTKALSFILSLVVFIDIIFILISMIIIYSHSDLKEITTK